MLNKMGGGGGMLVIQLKYAKIQKVIQICSFVFIIVYCTCNRQKSYQELLCFETENNFMISLRRNTILQ